MSPSSSDYISHGELRRTFAVAIAVSLCLVMFAAIFGTADIEGSANTEFSAGAEHAAGRLLPGARNFGTHSVLGVPVYDTLQGTGDRLPYQASWAQSITWPLRFGFGWGHYSLLRTLIFATAGLFLCLRTLQSWLPSIGVRAMLLFGLLASASFGLHLRQNDWSDHYVQTIGTCGIAMFMLRRDFVDHATDSRREDTLPALACLFVSLNGILSGHPGFWPITSSVCLALAIVHSNRKTYWTRIAECLRRHVAATTVAAVASILTVLAVFADVRGEVVGDSWQAGRLSRTQGLFSDFAYRSLIESQLGRFGIGVSETVESLIAAALASISMPFFVLFDGILPQTWRASSFPEIVRVEFTGSLVLIVLIAGAFRRSTSPIRSLMARVIAAEAIVWMFIIASTRDALPAALAASGAWMTAQVLLVLNLLLSFLVVASVNGFSRGVRMVAVVNLGLIGVWCAVQFGFTTFDSPLRMPARHDSWYATADAVSESAWYKTVQSEPQRIIITDLPRFGDLVGFVSLGVPVVAPADPKIRSSNQLQPNFSFNHSINPPHFEQEEVEYIDRVLDFLQVGHVLVGTITIDDKTRESQISSDFHLALASWSSGITVQIPQASLKVSSREKSSAFVMREDVEVEVCAVLFEQCAVIEQSAAREPLGRPRLSMCDGGCLWEYRAPAVGADELLVLPVTFDEALVVEDGNRRRVATVDRGGFLAVGGDVARDAGMLTVRLDADLRMWGRITASYVNLLALLALVLAALRSSSRRGSSASRSATPSR